MPRRYGAVLAFVLALAGGGCSRIGAAPATAPPTGPTGSLTVFAAASLTDAFEHMAATFEADHPGVSVTFNFAGSQQLRTQILEGAPADVFAPASRGYADDVADADRLAAGPVVFATTDLAIAVEPGNPQRITDLSDLARADLKVVLAAEEVPVGGYAREALDTAGVDVMPVSLETDVRAVLSKVTLGEADAGIVYASDIVAAGDAVAGVPIPGRGGVATYPAAVVTDTPNPVAARAFIAHLTSERGRAILERFGFETPSDATS